jgi:hypothetical protein
VYDPSIGRWTTEDPDGFDADDANLDRYVDNSPTNATDPTGTELIATDEQTAQQVQAYLRGESIQGWGGMADPVRTIRVDTRLVELGYGRWLIEPTDLGTAKAARARAWNYVENSTWAGDSKNYREYDLLTALTTTDVHKYVYKENGRLNYEGTGLSWEEMAAINNATNTLRYQDTPALEAQFRLLAAQDRPLLQRAGAQLPRENTSANTAAPVTRALQWRQDTLGDVPAETMNWAANPGSGGILYGNRVISRQVAANWLETDLLKRQRAFQPYEIGGETLFVSPSLVPSQRKQDVQTYLQENRRLELTIEVLRNEAKYPDVSKVAALSGNGHLVEVVGNQQQEVRAALLAAQDAQTLGVQIQGIFQTIGGAGELALAFTLAEAPEPFFTKAAAIAVGWRSIDNLNTGWQKALYGTPTQSYTAYYAASAARGLGADESTQLGVAFATEASFDVLSTTIAFRLHTMPAKPGVAGGPKFGQTGTVAPARTPTVFNPSQVEASLQHRIAAAATRRKVFVIGEDQARVARIARQQGGTHAIDFWVDEYNFRGFYDPEVHEAASIDFNRYMIRRLAQEGYEFADIGADAARTTRSPFYQAELEVLRDLGITPTRLP